MIKLKYHEKYFILFCFKTNMCYYIVVLSNTY